MSYKQLNQSAHIVSSGRPEEVKVPALQVKKVKARKVCIIFSYISFIPLDLGLLVGSGPLGLEPPPELTEQRMHSGCLEWLFIETLLVFSIEKKQGVCSIYTVW